MAMIIQPARFEDSAPPPPPDGGLILLDSLDELALPEGLLKEDDFNLLQEGP